MKQRDTSLDIIRITACFMVVMMHSPLPSENANGAFLACLSFFTAPCIGLFFMVCGALLLLLRHIILLTVLNSQLLQYKRSCFNKYDSSNII